MKRFKPQNETIKPFIRAVYFTFDFKNDTIKQMK